MNGHNPFWLNKRCLVTGGIGFLGSHLCRSLHESGARVTVIDSEPAHPGTLFSLLNRGRDIAVVQSDLSLPSAVEVVEQVRPDYVFHLAGMPYAPDTTLHPHKAFASNVTATVNVLEGARLCGAERFVLASSACVFGAARHSPLRVDDPPYPPEHYYSFTKREAERQAHAFQQLYGTSATICRFGNVFGPGDRHFGRIVPQMCRQLIKEGRESLELKRSRGESVFEFLYVEDAADAFVRAAENPSSAVETWQFSGGDGSRVSVLELARRISKVFDGKERSVTVSAANPERKVEKYLDTTHTKLGLKWGAGVDLDSGLKRTVEWYKEHMNTLTPREH